MQSPSLLPSAVVQANAAVEPPHTNGAEMRKVEKSSLNKITNFLFWFIRKVGKCVPNL